MARSVDGTRRPAPLPRERVPGDNTHSARDARDQDEDLMRLGIGGIGRPASVVQSPSTRGSSSGALPATPRPERASL